MFIPNSQRSFNAIEQKFTANAMPSLYSFKELDIRLPLGMANMQFAGEAKTGKASYGNPALAAQPKPNVIILINNPKDQVAINATHISAPHRTLVIVAHSGLDGVQKAGRVYYTSEEVASLIKKQAGGKLSQYDQIVFVSCRLALAGNSPKVADGSYAQNIANILGKPVYAATEFGFVESNGRISVAGSTTKTSGARKMDTEDPGRFIRFYPGGRPQNSSALQSALGEHKRADENKAGAGAKVDDEFSGSLKAGRCMNATVAQCIGK
jgi:hypothetical protein